MATLYAAEQLGFSIFVPYDITTNKGDPLAVAAGLQSPASWILCIVLAALWFTVPHTTTTHENVFYTTCFHDGGVYGAELVNNERGETKTRHAAPYVGRPWAVW